MDEKESNIWMVGGTVVITIPSDIVKDSIFPFKFEYKEENEIKTLTPFPITVKIDGKKLIIEKQ